MSTPPIHSRTRALALLVCLTIPALGQGQVPAPVQVEPAPNSGEEVAPKFVWGLLLNIVFKFAMQAFAGWLSNKLTTELNPSTTQKLLLESANAVIVTFADSSPFGSKGVGANENTTTAAATTPLKLENGKENYQGAHIALIAFSADGRPSGFRPLTAGFRTGERFKLKVLSTFDGVLAIENITPKGKRQQIYPARINDAIAIPAGKELLIPAAADQYFEFAGDSGDDILVVTLRDPKALPANASNEPVQREDGRAGSSFVQEVKPGKYPVIAQSIRLRHER